MRRSLKGFRALLRFSIASRCAPCRRFDACRILVVAPHPDDETLGCGLLIAGAALRGSAVWVALLTDGEASHRECCGLDPRVVAARRRGEAGRATAELGVMEVAWLGLPDGQLSTLSVAARTAATDGLAEVVARFAPDAIVAPYPRDAHPDHEAAAQLVAAVLRPSGSGCRLVNYITWGWFDAPGSFSRKLGLEASWRPAVQPGDALRKSRAAQTYFRGEMAPCGSPFGGRLPWSLRRIGTASTEVLVDGTPLG